MKYKKKDSDKINEYNKDDKNINFDKTADKDIADKLINKINEEFSENSNCNIDKSEKITEESIKKIDNINLKETNEQDLNRDIQSNPAYFENEDNNKKIIESISSGNVPQPKFETCKKIVKSKKNKYLFRAVWIVFLTFISILIASYTIVGMNDMLGIGKGNEPVSIEIQKGASLEVVSQTLKDRGIIRQKIFFKVYAIVTKNSKKFSAGSYELKPNMDYQAILNNLRNNDRNKQVVEIAFIEGMNIHECAQMLEDSGVCDKNEFLERCKSDDFDDKYDFLKNISNKDKRYYKLEGYLFPDTYEFYVGEDPSNVIRRFLNNFQKKTIKINNLKGYDKKTSIKQLSEESGKDLDEIINISSLIQAEAANKDDMYKVSSVIMNRVNITASDGKNKFGEFGLTKLGIDSTVWYPYKTRDSVPSNIVDIFKSSYNTYDIIGLPPGPICNPGMDAIYAALKPDKTDYFYFCHSKVGNAYYAKTNDVHLSNLKKAGLL